LRVKVKFIAKLEKILVYLKNSKLEYLKASDKYDIPEDKRFFNMQSTLRNRFFQDISTLLRSMNVEVDNLVINRLNFEQIASSSIAKTNHSHLSKCIEFDRNLIVLYLEALVMQPENDILKDQLDKITAVVKENIQFLENAGFVLES
tara:strand:+ start:10 stop:450 length:441 start_codon:yes stop_codon:yes gene_type:complete